MSYISELKKFYPRTYKQRYAINAYNTHKYFEHEDPTVITIHETTLNYGGPEEGGWWYQAGYPVRSHCVFNKKQAIQVFIEYFEEYEVEDQPNLGDTTTRSNIELGFSNELAKCYPTERPRYCWSHNTRSMPQTKEQLKDQGTLRLTLNQRNLYFYYLNFRKKYGKQICFVPKMPMQSTRIKEYFRALEALEEKNLIRVDRSKVPYTRWIMLDPEWSIGWHVKCANTCQYINTN